LKRRTPQFACNWDLALKQETQYLRRVRLQQAEGASQRKRTEYTANFLAQKRGQGLMPADIRMKPQSLDLVCIGVSEATGDASATCSVFFYWRKYIAKMRNQKD
jgi:hypothetical protein